MGGSASACCDVGEGDLITESGLTAVEERTLVEKFGGCSADEFLTEWNTTGAPRWWGIALYQAFTEIGDSAQNDSLNSIGDRPSFFRGVRRTVGNVGDVVTLVEKMFPDALTHEDGQVADRVGFVYWISGGSGEVPRNVTFDSVRDVIAWRVRSGLRKLLFDEPFTRYQNCESRAMDNTWALSLQFEPMEWDRLYCSTADGRSFARLVGNIQMYDAPSLLVIRTDAGAVLGAVNFQSWEDLGGQYSSADAFLFTDRPTFRIMRATGKSHNSVYLNQRNKYAPIGIGFGGQSSCPRLWIDSNFDGHFLQSDATFERGTINDDDDFQVSFAVQNMEVWGLGGPEALEKQQDLLGFKKELKQQRRKVDRALFAESAFDREMFLGKTFGMSEEGRAKVDEYRKEGQ
eukprot:GEMP01031205.1.p1 GENE.GEMP01031205.1~~GEMP01031205.1.p1  ORF type:complete len:402 (+),score=77.12 GEMP01031205.1:96-1301(+)